MIIFFIVAAGVVGLAWSWYNYSVLNKMEVEDINKIDEERLLKTEHPGVVEIGAIIRQGASAFISAEYKICSIFIIIMAGIVYVCVDNMDKWFTTVAFLTGAVTSMFCGAFGMQIATFSNYRTTLAAKNSLGSAFKTAFRAGCAMGFTLVSVSMIVLLILIYVYKNMMEIENSSEEKNYYYDLFEAVAGYGLGGSTIAMFARVGGGIFTKAADLGSDLVGKIEAGLPEDSPRNPATIADNVGDNVGDVAGMSADLFGSFAEATCAALVIGGNSIVDSEGVAHF